jgi:hypothetical protein
MKEKLKHVKDAIDLIENEDGIPSEPDDEQ